MFFQNPRNKLIEEHKLKVKIKDRPGSIIN